MFDKPHRCEGSLLGETRISQNFHIVLRHQSNLTHEGLEYRVGGWGACQVPTSQCSDRRISRDWLAAAQLYTACIMLKSLFDNGMHSRVHHQKSWMNVHSFGVRKICLTNFEWVHAPARIGECPSKKGNARKNCFVQCMPFIHSQQAKHQPSTLPHFSL